MTRHRLITIRYIRIQQRQQQQQDLLRQQQEQQVEEQLQQQQQQQASAPPSPAQQLVSLSLHAPAPAEEEDDIQEHKDDGDIENIDPQQQQQQQQEQVVCRKRSYNTISDSDRELVVNLFISHGLTAKKITETLSGRVKPKTVYSIIKTFTEQNRTHKKPKGGSVKRYTEKKEEEAGLQKEQ